MKYWQWISNHWFFLNLKTPRQNLLFCILVGEGDKNWMHLTVLSKIYKHGTYKSLQNASKQWFGANMNQRKSGFLEETEK